MLTSVVSDAGTDKARAEDVWFTCLSQSEAFSLSLRHFRQQQHLSFCQSMIRRTQPPVILTTALQIWRYQKFLKASVC